MKKYREESTKDESVKFMSRAVELARLGLGHTSPNPPVGAVVVKDGTIVGEGYHRAAGEPHAEIVALDAAGDKSKGAALYVTLEPCCYYGRTPPCVERIIKSDLKKVVVGARDPNPKVDGKGVECLRKSGIEVSEKKIFDECLELIRPHKKFFESGLPFVTIKIATSLDGKIALSNGESKWITNEKCREYVHYLRSISDAVMVGFGTALMDDPKLDVRNVSDGNTKHEARSMKTPRAVLIDEGLRLSLKANLYQRKPSSLIVATAENADPNAMKELKNRGYGLLAVPRVEDGFLDLKVLLSKLSEMNIRTLLVEGGAKLFSSLVKLGLVDRVVACIAPKFLGGSGLDVLPGVEFESMSDALQMKNVRISEFDDNVVVQGDVF